jgi:hypothetical protein
MAGTIVVDRLESDASYASSINIASPVIVSNTFAFPAGSNTAPAITPSGDTNTGIFFPAADTIAFSEGGVESMRISSTGTVAIGTTTTPTAKLWVESGRVGLTNAYKLGWHSNPAHGDLNNYITGDDGSNYVAIGTSAAERMRIDSSGYVTMPNQPAFHASRTSGAVSGTGIYICNSVKFNDGNHYNSSTGRFTAPVAGRYQVNFFVLAQNPDDFDMNIQVNGVLYEAMDFRCNSNAVNSNFTLSISAILKLSANDIVDPRVTSQPSGSIYGSGLNGFSMYFLG